MNLTWTPEGWEDYLSWANDKKILHKINELIKELLRHPFEGTGQPEPLRGNLTGWWSRRITGEHRLVYRIQGKGEDRTVVIVACRYHYR
jgi:toxin YoeB